MDGLGESLDVDGEKLRRDDATMVLRIDCRFVPKQMPHSLMTDVQSLGTRGGMASNRKKLGETPKIKQQYKYC